MGDKDYTVTLETGDLDNNDFPDIVAARYAWDDVLVWWDCAAGTPEAILGAHTPFVSQLEDCDGDGDLEVFIETGWTPSSRLFWNMGSGFQQQFIGDCYFTGRKAVADLDGGDYYEIAFSMFNDLYLYRHVPGDDWVLELISSNTSTPLFYDIDGDSEDDIINCFSGDLVFLYNLGQGNAWREGRLTASVPNKLAATDIDGDSVPEVTLYTPGGPAFWFLPQAEDYAYNGYLESTWLSPETDPTWNTVSFEDNGAPETNVTIQVRSSNDIASPPDWSPELNSGADISSYCSENHEYFQYRLNLYSSSTTETPTVTSFDLNWTTSLEKANEPIAELFQAICSPSHTPQLHIQIPVENSCQVVVFDVSGRICWSSVINTLPNKVHLYIVPNLPPGVYHARLLAGEKELFTRFVVAP